MPYQNHLLPSAHIAEVFYPLMGDERKVVDIVKRISEIDFYRGIELGIILDTQLAKVIRTIAEQKELRVTQWMTFELLKDNLNLSSLDKELREKSIKRARELVHLAAESGTTKLSMVSGSAPEDNYRNEAKKYLAESIVSISQEAKQYPNMNLQIEPLDRFAHKKQLIGFTDETVEWINQLKTDCSNLYLAWDSAHVALNEENLENSLKLAAPVISQIHLANAVLNKTDPLYGDYHMKFGPPGFLNEHTAISIIKTAMTLSTPPELKGTPIAIEMRTSDSEDGWKNEKQCRDFLSNALNIAAKES